jgi:hypothetical protein
LKLIISSTTSRCFQLTEAFGGNINTDNDLN